MLTEGHWKFLACNIVWVNLVNTAQRIALYVGTVRYTKITWIPPPQKWPPRASRQNFKYCRISKVLHFDQKKLPLLREFPFWVVSKGKKKRKKEEPGGLERGLLSWDPTPILPKTTNIFGFFLQGRSSSPGSWFENHPRRKNPRGGGGLSESINLCWFHVFTNYYLSSD